MRVYACRERPHPGAQLTLFEAEEGWRYSLWVTNLPERTRGWRGQLAYIGAADRCTSRGRHLHRERHRDRQVPVHQLAQNRAWLTASTLLA
jgi:hypothetical protein